MLCFSQQLHQTWTTGRVANSERPQWTYGLPGPNQRKKVRGTVQARGCVFLFFSFLFLTECIGVGVGGVLVLFFFRGEGFPIEKKKKTEMSGCCFDDVETSGACEERYTIYFW